MARAIELMTRKRLSVTQTALEVGFNSVAAFTLAFSSFTGKTPSSYTRDFLNETFIPNNAMGSRIESEV